MSDKLGWPGPKLLTGLYLAVLLLLGWWLVATAPADLRRQLAVVSPRGLELSFLLMVVGAFAARKAIRRSLQGSRLAPILLFLGGLVAVAILPPRTHRIFYDEDIYQNVAQNILWAGRAEMCNEGILEWGAFHCNSGEYNKEPSAFPFLLSLVFRLAGVSEAAAHALNRLLFALGVLSAFWAGLLLFRDRGAAVAAGLIFLLTPENLLWGGTVAVEPGAAAFGGLALASWLLFIEEGSASTAAFAAATLAFAAQWRAESFLLVPLLGLATILLKPERLRERKSYAAGLLCLLLLLPQLGHLWAVRSEGWGSPQDGDGEKFSWRYVPGNLKTNASYYVEGREQPLFFTLLALLGLSSEGRWREKATAGAWFLLFFGIFIPFHAGSYRYGADIRFSLLSAMPLALFAGLGSSWLSGYLASRVPASRLAQSAPLIGVLYSFSGFLPLVRSLGTEAWAARADHEAAREMLGLVPEEAILLTHNPGMIQVMGRSAAQASIARYEPQRVNTFFGRFPGGVYFHYSFWCNVADPAQNAFCITILERYPHQVVSERSAGSYRYVLYRLLPPPPGSGPKS